MKNIAISLIILINIVCVTNAHDTKVKLQLILPEALERPSNYIFIPIPVILFIHNDARSDDTYIKLPVVLGTDDKVYTTQLLDIRIVDDKGNDIPVAQGVPNFDFGLALLMSAQSRARLLPARSISAKIDKPGGYHIYIEFNVTDNRGNTLPVRGDVKFNVIGADRRGQAGADRRGRGGRPKGSGRCAKQSLVPLAR